MIYDILGAIIFMLFIGFLFYLVIEVIFWLVADHFKKKAFSLITKCFNSEVGIDEEELKLIYNKYIDKSITYASFIEQYFIFIRNKNTTEIKDFSNVYTFLKGIINREQNSVPYIGIDERERKNLLSIENALRDNKSYESVKDDLSDLSSAIRNTENRLKKTKRLNAWTIPLAVVSFVFTVLSFFGGARISDKDYEKIGRHISIAISHSLDSLSLNSGDKTLDLDLSEEEDLSALE